MPEFLLRGSKGAYDSKEMFDSNNDEEDGILIQMADKLRELIRDDAFKDYLFVLGTVIIAEPADHESNHWKMLLIFSTTILLQYIVEVKIGGIR